jgi:hypothetical protein
MGLSGSLRSRGAPAERFRGVNTIPARQAGHIVNRVVSVIAGMALAVLIIQHSATRRRQGD